MSCDQFLTGFLHYAIAAYRVTLADVGNRASTCLAQFVLGGKFFLFFSTWIFLVIFGNANSCIFVTDGFFALCSKHAYGVDSLHRLLVCSYRSVQWSLLLVFLYVVEATWSPWIFRLWLLYSFHSSVRISQRVVMASTNDYQNESVTGTGIRRQEPSTFTLKPRVVRHLTTSDPNSGYLIWAIEFRW